VESSKKELSEEDNSSEIMIKEEEPMMMKSVDKMNMLESFKEVKGQPDFHTNNLTVCMKVFPQLAERTNLTAEELKTYFFIRCTYSVPFEKEKHDG